MANVSFFKTCEKRPDILAAVSKANVMRTDMRFAWKQVDFQMIISPGLAPEPFSEPAKKSCFLRWKPGIDKPPGTAIRLFEAIIPSIDAGQEARITVCVCKGPIDASFKTVIYPASVVIPSRSSSTSPRNRKLNTARRDGLNPLLI